MRKTKISLCILTLGWVLSGCAGFFVGKDNAPAPTVLDTSVSSTMVQKVWSAKASGSSLKTGLRFTIGHDAGNVYVANAKGGVTALDISTGQKRWSKNVGALYTGAGANGSQVFVGAKNGRLIALSAANGEELWAADLYGAPVTTPVSDATRVIVRTLGGAVQSFDTATGEASWAYMIATPDMNLRGGAAPVIAHSQLLVPTDMGQLGVLNLNDGKVLGGQNLGKIRGGSAMARVIDIDAEPIVDNGMVYVGVARSGIAALSLNTLQVQWRLDHGVYSGLAVDSQTVYAVHDDGTINALSKANGNAQWSSEALLHRKLTRPVVLNNRLIVGDAQGYVHVLDLNSGALMGSTRITKSAFFPDILLLNGGIILQDVSGGVHRVTL